MKKRNVDKKKYFLIILFLFYVMPSVLSADNTAWKIVSPQPESTINNGELFIIFSPQANTSTKKGLILVYLDGKKIDKKPKYSGGRYSLLYLQPLNSGGHRLSIHAMDDNGKMLPTTAWTFNVSSQTVSLSFNPIRSSLALNESDIGLKFNTRLQSRNEFLSGKGVSLRQEPASTNELNINGEAKYKLFTFPFKYFKTSEESGQQQSRNHYQIGAKSEILEAYIGDNFPRYGRLILNGKRLRGFKFALHLGGIHFDFATGDLNRAVKGTISNWDSLSGLPPVNLQSDSTIITPGTYNRKLTSGRLSIGNQNIFLISFTFSKSKDDVKSIKYGVDPAENIVAGSDFVLNILDGKFRFKGGAAFSITTNDISGGTFTKNDLDSLAGRELSFDPGTYSKFITINASTVPLKFDKMKSIAWYFNGRARVFNHSLYAEMKSIGPAYFSFGNPFLRNDRKGFLVSDRFKVYKNHLTASLRYQRMQDNLNSDQFATRTSNMFSSSFIVFLRPDLPYFTLGYLNTNRVSDKDFAGKVQTDDEHNTYNLGLLYNFRYANIHYAANFSYSLSDRNDKVNPNTGTNYSTYSLGLSGKFKIPLLVSVRISSLTLEMESGKILSEQFTSNLNARYSLLDKKLDLKASINNASLSTPNSNRFSMEVGAEYNFLSNMSLELRAGISTFSDNNTANRNYNESYIVITHKYGFNYF